MNERPAVYLLWADDESEGILDPLSWDLNEENGFRLRRKINYSDAVEALKEDDFGALLVDIILPHSTGTGIGTIDDNLGIELADEAAKRGARVIAFLTVAPRVEVAKKFEELEQKYPDVTFRFYDKLTLLDRIDELLEFLQQGRG